MLITDEDVARFAAASGDHSPLHTDGLYARRTAFGRPVAHGVLVALSALGELAPPTIERHLVDIALDFRAPIFPGEALDVAVLSCSELAVHVRVSREGAVLLDIKAGFAAGVRAASRPSAAVFPRSAAATPAPGAVALDFAWSPAAEPFVALQRSLGARLDAGALAFLLACSYAVGMEAPGAQALFMRLVARFDNAREIELPLKLKLRASKVDERFGLSKISFVAEPAPGSVAASAEIQAVWRPEAARLDVGLLDVGAAPVLREKAALVVGGSRGLGAAIAAGLARLGARCTATYVATVPSDRQENVDLVQSDASDAAACSRLRDHVGPLDVLVLNASPAIRDLKLSAETTPRLLAETLAFFGAVATPLAALADRLTDDATVVLCSSSALDEPVPQWPHYLAGKAAAEALVSSLSIARPGLRILVVRPPRLKTDLTSTPRGWASAVAPEIVASDIVRRVATREAPGVHLMRWPVR